MINAAKEVVSHKCKRTENARHHIRVKPFHLKVIIHKLVDNISKKMQVNWKPATLAQKKPMFQKNVTLLI